VKREDALRLREVKNLYLRSGEVLLCHHNDFAHPKICFSASLLKEGEDPLMRCAALRLGFLKPETDLEFCLHLTGKMELRLDYYPLLPGETFFFKASEFFLCDVRALRDALSLCECFLSSDVDTRDAFQFVIAASTPKAVVPEGEGILVTTC